MVSGSVYFVLVVFFRRGDRGSLSGRASGGGAEAIARLKIIQGKHGPAVDGMDPCGHERSSIQRYNRGFEVHIYM